MTSETATKHNGALSKAAFVERIATRFDLSKAHSAELFDFVFATLKQNIQQAGGLAISGFGTFKVSERPARTARNPRTGAAVEVEASKTVRFKPASGFKDAL
jgi:nucleoid DNA-binding protein